jgi:hypothetical protein
LPLAAWRVRKTQKCDLLSNRCSPPTILFPGYFTPPT